MLLIVLGLFLGVALAEGVCRMLLPAPAGPFAHNPVIREQASGVDLFELDEALGHRLRDAAFIGVYKKGLVTAEEIAQDPRRDGKLLVLNLGDSSTSGWNSDVVVENGRRHARKQKPHSPFQTYLTYSDILAQDPRLYVVNAGVPGFTSLQGTKYLRILLERFRNLGVRVGVVTIYFGNNDSAWNGNIQDKYVLPDTGFQLQLLRLIDQATNSFQVIPRVPSADYAEQVREMLRECREAGLDVVVVEPVIPKYWTPGLRARGLKPDTVDQDGILEDSKVRELLHEARVLFEKGRRALERGAWNKAAAAFREAQEKDFLVPRIKDTHAAALRRVAQEERTSLVSVGNRIPIDDRTYFVDYCHPIEPANRLIAQGILEKIEQQWARRRQ